MALGQIGRFLMVKFRNTMLAALGLIILNTVIVLYATKTGHAGSPVPVVQITGTASTEEVNNPDFQPVQFELEPGTYSGDPAATFTVPSHKRLVIEYIAASTDTSSDFPNLNLGLATIAGGTPADYTLFQQKNDQQSVNALVHITADPGTTVQAFLGSSAASPNAFDQQTAAVIVSGYYIDD